MARGETAEEGALEDPPEGGAGRRPAGWIAVLLAVSGLPVVVLAVAALTGLGLARNLATVPSVLTGLALVLLPILGLATIVGTGFRMAELAGCSWFWSLAVLLVMPFYFPGERSQATAAGLVVLASPLGQGASARVRSAGEALVSLLGAEPKPTPLAPALPGPAAEAARAADAARRVREQREAQGDVVIPYQDHSQTLHVAAFFDGPRYGEEFPMIFDTGATYTTLNRPALDLLEVDVPADAPRVVLRTANGEVEAPLVLVDAVWLGDAAVEWVTVAVCDSCATDEVSGLLGLNVTGQFQVSLDHDHHQIQLGALGGEENRKLDIAQWLKLESRLLRWRDGRVEVEVTGRNRARAPMRDVSTEIECPGGSFEVVLDRVPPHGRMTRKMALPRGTDCSEYSLSLRSGAWESDRFK